MLNMPGVGQHATLMSSWYTHTPVSANELSCVTQLEHYTHTHTPVAWVETSSCRGRWCNAPTWWHWLQQQITLISDVSMTDHFICSLHSDHYSLWHDLSLSSMSDPRMASN